MRLPRILLLCLMACTFDKQPCLAALQSGPMVGYVDMREAAIWVQTERPANVSVTCYPDDRPEAMLLSSGETTAASRNILSLQLGPLEPGTAYRYQVSIDGVAQTFPFETRFRTPPDYLDRFPPLDASFVFLGGHYVNERQYDPLNRIPGGGYEIFDVIKQESPDLMFWVGNNCHYREADWGSVSGMVARQMMARSEPKLAPLLASVPQQATWSQQDFGPARADRLWLGSRDALSVFKAFWANRYEAADSLTTTARWSDVECFILDDRSFRYVPAQTESKREMLGKAQMDWLVESLSRSTAHFKIVICGSSLLSPAENLNNYTVANTERDAFFSALKREDLNGLFFVAGGKSVGEMTKMVRAGGYDLWEVSVGPVTARPDTKNTDLNYFRVPGTTSLERHFVKVNVTGPEDDRKLVVSAINVSGKTLWQETLPHKNLQNRQR